MVRRLVVLVAAAALWLVSPAALAKAQMDSPYSYRQTFGSALRLLKVDMGFQLTEVNADWGYLLFEYVTPETGSRKNHASIQFVESEQNAAVQVSVQVPQMPSYHEDGIIDRLKHKLQEEHGAPPEPKKRKPKEKDDAGKDGDKDKRKDGGDGDEDRRGRNPDNVRILEPERDTLKKKRDS